MSVTDSLTATSKRPMVHDAKLMIKHPSAVREVVKAIAEESGLSEGAVWKEAMAEYLAKRGF